MVKGKIKLTNLPEADIPTTLKVAKRGIKLPLKGLKGGKKK